MAAAVLERVEAGRDVEVRFRHDKLREALQGEIVTAARPARARRVGAGAAGEEPQQLAPLARHYQAAGNGEKELAFAARAGEQALRSRAVSESMSSWSAPASWPSAWLAVTCCRACTRCAPVACAALGVG
ncbi:MAG: hypothetical protein QM756_01540 [Polyangiaceae bacterium]